jgi:hypothetical protein
MPANSIPIRLASPDSTTSLAEKLLIDVAELAYLTSLSVRHLRRLDSSGDIPGRTTIGRRVLFQTEIIRQWVRTGLPDRDHWQAIEAAARSPNGKVCK